MTQPPLAIVRAWQEKSTEVSIRSKDQLFTAASKGFDAMAALLAKDSDPASGLVLLCECGNASRSETHSLTCNHVNITVIRKRDGPIGRLDDKKTTPQCVLCEAYPRTAYGYTHHLQIHHKSTLAQNGIYLMCSCGVEVRSNNSFKHIEEKRKSIKGEEKSGYASKKPNVAKENATDLECPECEFSTRIVNTWILHLRKKHSTTPSLAGVVLLCECGHESLSNKHSLKCNDGSTTVIRKRDGPIGRLDDEKTTPQCVLCEAFPRTACGYAYHLYDHHKFTLIQNGIYLMCSCGLEVRSNKSHKHLDECNPRQFTLHKLNDE